MPNELFGENQQGKGLTPQTEAFVAPDLFAARERVNSARLDQEAQQAAEAEAAAAAEAAHQAAEQYPLG